MGESRDHGELVDIVWKGKIKKGEDGTDADEGEKDDYGEARDWRDAKMVKTAIPVPVPVPREDTTSLHFTSFHFLHFLSLSYHFLPSRRNRTPS